MFQKPGSKIIQPNQANYISGGGGGGTGPMGSMMKQMAGMGLKTALSGSPMAPLAGVLGSLFNNGGKVGGHNPDTFVNGKIASKHYVSPLPVQRNMGGPLSKNPHGYNEGGAVMETPIKKVMDEQKLMQQQVAFDMDQARKQEAHDMAMKQKQQQFALAQKLKKDSATTAAKPKAPLSK